MLFTRPLRNIKVQILTISHKIELMGWILENFGSLENLSIHWGLSIQTGVGISGSELVRIANHPVSEFGWKLSKFGYRNASAFKQGVGVSVPEQFGFRDHSKLSFKITEILPISTLSRTPYYIPIVAFLTWIESVSCSSAGSFLDDDVDEEADDVCFPFAVPFTTSRNLFKEKVKIIF